MNDVPTDLFINIRDYWRLFLLIKYTVPCARVLRIGKSIVRVNVQSGYCMIPFSKGTLVVYDNDTNDVSDPNGRTDDRIDCGERCKVSDYRHTTCTLPNSLLDDATLCEYRRDIRELRSRIASYEASSNNLFSRCAYFLDTREVYYAQDSYPTKVSVAPDNNCGKYKNFQTLADKGKKSNSDPLYYLTFDHGSLERCPKHLFLTCNEILQLEEDFGQLKLPYLYEIICQGALMIGKYLDTTLLGKAIVSINGFKKIILRSSLLTRDTCIESNGARNNDERNSIGGASKGCVENGSDAIDERRGARLNMLSDDYDNGNPRDIPSVGEHPYSSKDSKTASTDIDAGENGDSDHDDDTQKISRLATSEYTQMYSENCQKLRLFCAFADWRLKNVEDEYVVGDHVRTNFDMVANTSVIIRKSRVIVQTTFVPTMKITHVPQNGFLLHVGTIYSNFPIAVESWKLNVKYHVAAETLHIYDIFYSYGTSFALGKVFEKLLFDLQVTKQSKYVSIIRLQMTFVEIDYTFKLLNAYGQKGMIVRDDLSNLRRADGGPVDVITSLYSFVGRSAFSQLREQIDSGGMQDIYFSPKCYEKRKTVYPPDYDFSKDPCWRRVGRGGYVDFFVTSEYCHDFFHYSSAIDGRNSMRCDKLTYNAFLLNNVSSAIFSKICEHDSPEILHTKKFVSQKVLDIMDLFRCYNREISFDILQDATKRKRARDRDTMDAVKKLKM